jgi:hypothetical protein
VHVCREVYERVSASACCADSNRIIQIDRSAARYRTPFGPNQRDDFAPGISQCAYEMSPHEARGTGHHDSHV